MSAEEVPAAAAAVELEIPDVIERLPKPDKAEHEAKIAVLDGAIKQLQARSNVIRAEMDALKTNRGGYGGQIQEAKAAFAALRAEKDNLIQQRNQITARLRQTRDEKDSTLKHQRSARASLKFGSEAEFDAAIAALKLKQETSSMSLNEEKRVIKEIEQLQAQRLQVAAFSGDQGVVDRQNESIKETRALQSKKNEEIDALQEKLNAQKQALDELYRLNEEENKKDKFPALAKERKDIKEQLDDKFTAIKALRKDFKEANDKYYNNIRLVRKKKELERQKEEEARKAEYEAKLADYEKEMAKIHPYQDEMDLCDALVSFLEKTYAKELKEEDDKAEAAAAPVELDGMKPLQRKEEDFMMLGGGKKSKKGRAGKKSKKPAKLVLPLAQMEAFSTIGLLPPSAVSAVSESLAAVKAKKVWFNEQTSRPKADKPAEAAAEAAAPAKVASPKKKSNKNKKFNAGDNDAFPSLGGVAAELPSWGPGMAAPVAAEPAVAAEFAGADVVTEDE
ncbi:lipoprotein, type 6 [Phytophthora cinnamomi]|uniref:lipoprotein, type 6 n=1 Tax=Phytophthora cinnamomi TaxID=4785 RepID=UPI00355A8D3D|nr:lipoprotein, type 6 [Phytophthora cinnamomi]